MKYLALTIGPIYKMLSTAKKTRELWGGSYLFSYIMKEIISAFKEREFIVPYIKDKSIFESGSEVGLFHDRFIFEAEDGDKKKLEETVENVLKSLSENTPLDFDFIKNYFHIHIVEKELEENANPILELTPYLDTAELFYSIGQYNENQLTRMLQGNNAFLTKDAFGGKKPFPSLPQIALYDMIKENPEIIQLISKEDELNIYDHKELDFKPYHKYYAIVHADGDSMGKVIEHFANNEDFHDFSQKLFEYCTASHQLISQYGGETIFAGGDDLLFFAPVVSGTKTVFDLCDEISEDFDSKFNAQATLSFGISIQYHKFPLYEALEKSRDLLFVDAKKGNKNNIAFSVTKHSGQTFTSVIHKGNKELYANFKRLSSNINRNEGLDNFLHSLHHKIDTYKVILIEIADNKQSLKNFFDNYFNKEEHTRYREIFDQVIEFIHISRNYVDKKDTSLESVYATLRFIKFIQGDKA